MVDQLDLQILEIIEKAPSIVRSVTESEIERGVLSPSVTTMDIKRNLPYNVNTNIIEGRLKALEDEGYIYYETSRWWLTSKGRKILGRTVSQSSPMSTASKSMRTILEETFAKFESELLDSKKAKDTSEDIEEVRKRRAQAETLLSELKRSYNLGLISDEEFKHLSERVDQRLSELKLQTEAYIQKRRNDLLKEIEDLESKLAKKKIDLEKLNQLMSEKNNP